MVRVSVAKQLGAFKVEVSFTGGETGVTALFGVSGAGKTSVVNMVAGLLRPDGGYISLGECVFFDSERGVELPPERRRIGCVFQDGRLFPHISVRANLLYGMKLVPSAQRYVKFEQVVELLGIGHLLGRSPVKLSGGERQRVALGRALLTSPRLLLMDEPLASLDAPRRADLLKYIGRLPKEFGLPILYVSHAVEEIVRLADTVIVMDGGRVVAAGGLGDFLDGLPRWARCDPLSASSLESPP